MGVVVGTGTGRCGTTSLALLFGLTHERQHGANSRKLRFSRIFDAHIVASTPYATRWIGKEHYGNDVAYYWLWHVPLIVEQTPGARVLIVERDEDETVRSFVAWSRAPSGATSMREQDYRDYVRICHARSRVLERRYPLNVFRFPMRLLNSERGLETIADFAGIKPDLSHMGVRYNAS